MHILALKLAPRGTIVGDQIQFTSEGQILFNGTQIVFNCDCCEGVTCYCSTRMPSIDVEFDADFYDPASEVWECERCPEYGTTLFTVPFDPVTTKELQDASINACWYQIEDTGICYLKDDIEDTPPFHGPSVNLVVSFTFNIFGGVELRVSLNFSYGFTSFSYVGIKTWGSVSAFEADGGCEGTHEGDLGTSASGAPNDYCPLVVDQPTPKWRINP